MAQSLRVLLVEDDEVDRMAVHRAVAGATPRLELFDAATLEGGLDAARAETYDCILVDYSLPDGSAVELLEQLSQLEQTSPIVILTGLDDEDTAMEMLKRGAQDYLLKSHIDSSTLSRAIRYAIQRQHVTSLQHRLVEADRLSAIGQLATGIAHEINNPACYILANLGFVRENLADLARLLARLDGETRARLDGDGLGELLSESDEAIGDSVHGIERICKIVQELRPFSRIQREQLDRLDLNEVVESALGLTRNEIRHRAQLDKRLGDLPLIVGDRAELCQVVVHLLSNATQSIEEGAADRNSITVATRSEAGSVVLVVSDTGEGISEGDRRHVFEPFFTTRTREVGTGLGLAVCAETVRKHQGDIQLRSVPGVGTHVEVRIPVAAGQEREAGAAEPSRILLIDDDRLVRSGLRRLLTPTYTVVEADSGAAALALLEREDFDVILCDLMMPEVDGPAVYERLAESHPELLSRIVFLTGGAFTERVRSFMDQVEAPVLEKPVGRARLLATLEQVDQDG